MDGWFAMDNGKSQNGKFSFFFFFVALFVWVILFKTIHGVYTHLNLRKYMYVDVRVRCIILSSRLVFISMFMRFLSLGLI